MYFCRRFLGLVLTGLFVSSLLASVDGPKEYNKYKLPLSRSNSEVQPKVLVKSIDQVDRAVRTISIAPETHRTISGIEANPTSRPGCDDCEFDFTN